MSAIKKVLIAETAARLSAMGIPTECGNGSDIIVRAELVEAGWSTGKKKITFEASVLYDDARTTALMWQKTSEVNSGFSFGASGETNFQLGKNLFRRLKAVQYGPGGKAYEYDIDLGAITRAVEETAKKNGWKFKTVLRRASAAYPEGCASAPQPAVPVSRASFCGGCGEPATGAYCGKCGGLI